MLFSPSSLPIMPMLYTSLNYDPMTDLMPISLLGKYPNLIVVSKKSPVNSLKEFIDNAKANPGKVTFATPGIGTTPHLTAELFKKMAGVDLTHVPYRGVAAGAMSDLITNRIDCDVQHHRLVAPGGALGPGARVGAVDAGALAAGAGAADLRRSRRAGASTFRHGTACSRPPRRRREIVTKMHDDVAKMLTEPETKKKIRGARHRGGERNARSD